MEVFEKRRIGGWEKVSGLIGFKLQPEENRKNGILKISSWKEILQHANRRVFYTVLACVEQSVFECACVCSKPVMLRGLCKVSAAVVLSSASSAVWRAALRFSWDPLGFESLISKLLEVDFDLAFKALLSLFPLAFTQCCILAHIWLDRSDHTWSRWDWGIPVFHVLPFMSHPRNHKPIHL